MNKMSKPNPFKNKESKAEERAEKRMPPAAYKRGEMAEKGGRYMNGGAVKTCAGCKSPAKCKAAGKCLAKGR